MTSGFRSMMEEELSALMDSMDASDKAQTENYRRVEALLNAINTTSLADLKNGLAELETETEQMGIDLTGKIDQFRTGTMDRLDNISQLMATVDDIKSLATEVKTVQTGVNDVEKEQETTSKNVAALGLPSWLGIVLVIIVLLLAAVQLMRVGKKEAAPASKPQQPEAPPED